MAIKPYYTNGQSTIYCGDSQTVLKGFDNDSIDLIITDPPYGQDYQSGYRQIPFEKLQNDHTDATELVVMIFNLCLIVLKPLRHAYCFGRFDFSKAATAELIWNKDNLSLGDLTLPWAKSYEYVQFLVNTKGQMHASIPRAGLTTKLRKGSVLNYSTRGFARSMVHPTQKPVGLLREFVESSSKFGEIVLDPFMGSGSTLVAAQAEGRKSIGVEIEEKYCEIAAKRLAQLQLITPGDLDNVNT